MDKEKLLQEHKAVIESLIEKLKFIHSEDFDKLDENEKQKIMTNKMANEGYLNSLSSMLWAQTHQANNAPDIFPLLLFMLMFNNMGNSSLFSTPQPCTLPTEPNAGAEETKAE